MGSELGSFEVAWLRIAQGGVAKRPVECAAEIGIGAGLPGREPSILGDGRSGAGPSGRDPHPTGSLLLRSPFNTYTLVLRVEVTGPATTTISTTILARVLDYHPGVTSPRVLGH